MNPQPPSDTTERPAPPRAPASPRPPEVRSALAYRVYRALLVFVVVIGLPIVALPVLRHRLSSRVDVLRSGMGREAFKSPPAWAKVGENRYPLPIELLRPKPLGPVPGGVVTLPGYVYRPHPGEAGERQAGAPPAGDTASAPTDEAAAPEYRQGKAEAEAFELVKSKAPVAALLAGGNPSLRFKGWGAARREGESFWVDLTFVDSSDAANAREVHYIWKVDPASRQVTPLSHNARALSR